MIVVPFPSWISPVLSNNDPNLFCYLENTKCWFLLLYILSTRILVQRRRMSTHSVMESSAVLLQWLQSLLKHSVVFHAAAFSAVTCWGHYLHNAAFSCSGSKGWKVFPGGWMHFSLEHLKLSLKESDAQGTDCPCWSYRLFLLQEWDAGKFSGVISGLLFRRSRSALQTAVRHFKQTILVKLSKMSSWSGRQDRLLSLKGRLWLFRNQGSSTHF